MKIMFGCLAKLPNVISRPKFIFTSVAGSLIIAAASLCQAHSRVVDLETSLSIADSANPEIRSGLSRIRESQQRRIQVKSNLLPQVSASASYNRLGEVPPGKKYLLGSSNNDIYTDVTVKQLLFDGGKYRFQISASDTLTKAEEQKLSQTRRNIRLAVARAYYETVKAKYAVTVQRELIVRMQTQLNMAELLFEGGKNSSLDVARLRTQVLTAQGQLNTLESQVKMKQYLLAQAIGISDTCEAADSVLSQNQNELQIDERSLAKELGEAPELYVAHAAYDKSLLDQRIAEADYLPTVSMSAGYNFEGGTFMVNEPSGVITKNPNWTIGASVMVPIYRGGGAHAQAAQAHERVEQAGYLVEQTMVNLTARLKSAIESVKDKQEKITIAKQILESADETVRTAELRYSTGKLSAFELIDAQNIFARSQQDYFNARVDYRIALEELAVICPSILKKENKK
jgi:outer membrane protein